MNSRHQLVGLIVCVAISLGAGGIGLVLDTPAVQIWYPTLAKPSWTPPSWVFSPVWTTLYFMMAVAAWLVWRRFGWGGARVALALFACQLVLNVVWSGVFFALRRPGLAFVESVLLWVMILLTIIKFWPLSRTAGWLLMPYLLWVAYAVALNFAIWRMNV